MQSLDDLDLEATPPRAAGWECGTVGVVGCLLSRTTRGSEADSVRRDAGGRALDRRCVACGVGQGAVLVSMTWPRAGVHELPQREALSSRIASHRMGGSLGLVFLEKNYSTSSRFELVNISCSSAQLSTTDSFFKAKKKRRS
jgi:hypothetical protein